MSNTLAEVEELGEIRENVRRCIEALEFCWSCQRVSECRQGYVDDGSVVWLCSACWSQTQSRLQAAPGALLWPSL